MTVPPLGHIVLRISTLQPEKPPMLLSRLFLVSVTAMMFAYAGAALAFTIEGGPGADGATSKWQDLDIPNAKAGDPDSRFKKTDDGRTEFKSGNSSLYF